MPINIEFVVHRDHAIQKAAGYISAVPAFETAGRLYAIHNASTSRHVYVGTAGNLQTRFTARIAAVRELGLNNAAINPITVHAFRVLVNAQARQPNDLGVAGGYDVEHLLIRWHIAIGVTTRNISKIGPYQNASGQVINLRLWAAPGLAIPAYWGGAGVNVAIPNGAAY